MMDIFNLISQVVVLVCRVVSATCSVLTYLKRNKKK